MAQGVTVGNCTRTGSVERSSTLFDAHSGTGSQWSKRLTASLPAGQPESRVNRDARSD